MHELSCELVALRQEMRGLRETVRELRDQVGDLRRQSSEKNEQVVILRTQFRVLWAVAGTAGASGLGAAALGVLRFIPGVGGAVADTAWRLLAPQQDKVADAKRDLHAAGFQQLVQLIDGLRGEHTVAMLKTEIAAKAPSAVGDAFKHLATSSPS